MKLVYKNNFWGYFNFYYSIVGSKLIVFLFLSIVISFLDGMGLAMFIPLLQFAGERAGSSSEHSLGLLHYVTDLIQKLGFHLTITTVLLTLILLFVSKGALKYIQLTYYARLRFSFIQRVRYSLLDNLQGLTYSAFLKLDAGKIQSTLTSEVSRLFTTMHYYFNAAQSFVMLLTYMVLAVFANYQFALLVAVGAVVSSAIYKNIHTKTKRASIQVSGRGNEFSSFGMQVIHYFKYLKSTNSFKTYAAKLKNVVDLTERLNQKIGYMNAILSSVREPIIIIIVSGVILLQLNWLGTSLNTIILSLLLLYRSLSLLVLIQNHWQGFIENIGGMNAVAVLSQEMASSQEKQGIEEFHGIQKNIQLEDVIFFYDTVKVLNGINITIPKNSTIALVGESGSGKTTIANMITGLIEPTDGQVTIDGIPLKKYNLNYYRSKIGYISQESVIFNDTIFNNITFWAEPTVQNVKRFDEIVAMASLAEFVQAQPVREQTKLGDHGILISGGQKQRISIARELYKKAEILIFDEATSALDSETEKMIRENIGILHGHYTMIIIAHRLSTIKEADIIYLLEEGKIAASGSFEEMMQTSSKFKRMVLLQGFS